VLVGGGVEDGVGLVTIEDLVEARRVADVGNDGDKADRGEGLEQLVVDLEDLVLAVVENHELGGPERGNLAAEFTANGAAGAGDEHDLALDELGHRAEVGGDGVAAEQVLDGDLPQAQGVDAAVYDVADAGDNARGDAEGEGGIDDLADEGALGPRDGNDDLGGLPLLDGFAQLGDRTNDGEAAEHLALLVGVVVDEGDGEDVGAEGGRLREVAQDRLAQVAGADNDGAVLGAVTDGVVAGGKADGNAGDGQDGGGEQGVEQERRERQADIGEAKAADEKGAGDEGEHPRHCAGVDQVLELDEGGVAPEEAIDAGAVGHADAGGEGDGGVGDDRPREVGRPGERFHAERHGQEGQGRQQDEIYEE